MALSLPFSLSVFGQQLQWRNNQDEPNFQVITDSLKPFYHRGNEHYLARLSDMNETDICQLNEHDLNVYALVANNADNYDVIGKMLVA